MSATINPNEKAAQFGDRASSVKSDQKEAEKLAVIDGGNKKEETKEKKVSENSDTLS